MVASDERETIIKTISKLRGDKHWWYSATPIGSLPPRVSHSTALVGNTLYVFGGMHNDKYYDTMHALDTGMHTLHSTTQLTTYYSSLIAHHSL